jgi:hypothetical protein
LLTLVRPKPDKDNGDDKMPPSAAEILDHIKAALEKGVEPGSAKYTALAERIRLLRDRIIQNAQDALEFLSEALRVCACRKPHPGRSSGMFVLVEDAAEAIVSSDAEPGYLVRIGDRFG